MTMMLSDLQFNNNR